MSTPSTANLTPAQREIVRDTHRFRVICAGRRFGKTELSAWEMKGYAVMRKDARVAYISPTFQQSRDIAWLTLKRNCQDAITNVNETRLELTLRNQHGGTGSIWLRGWESVETLRGQRFDFIVIDEVASMKNFWANWQEIIRPTLTDTKGDVLFISTPKGFNSFYDLYGLEAQDKDYKSFHFTSYDNPHIPAEEIDKARTELTEDRFAQEYLADFRKTEGLVYKEFDRQQHIFTGTGPTHRNRILVGIDWGFTNPAAVLDIVEDSDRSYWVMSEWYKAGKTTEEIVEVAASYAGNCYYPDPAEPDRIEILKRKRLNVMEVNKDVAAGISSVRNLLKQGKLHIHSSCVNLINEFETYSYQEKKADKNAPEEPVKENDHALDALRYALHMASHASAIRQATQFTPASQPYRRQSIRTGLKVV